MRSNAFPARACSSACIGQLRAGLGGAAELALASWGLRLSDSRASHPQLQMPLETILHGHASLRRICTDKGALSESVRSLVCTFCMLVQE